MMKRESGRFRVRARGAMACFTRPEMKAERVSYEVMTPSAGRGVLDAVLWKPAIRWQIHEIAVLAPIQWTSFRRNEVGDRSSPKVRDFYVEDRRAQRNTVALRDVDYVLTCSFTLTAQAGPEDNVRKFEEMFERRLERGQCFQQPFLGCREFAAEVEPAPATVQPIQPEVDRPLGLLFYDFDHGPGRGAPVRPLFFEARLRGGVLQVPSRDEVLRANGGSP